MKICLLTCLHTLKALLTNGGWLRGTVVECQTLAGELSLSQAQPALLWVNRPLQVSRPGQLSFSSFRGREMSSKLELDV